MGGSRQSKDWNRAHTAASTHSEASRHKRYLELLAEPIPGGDAKRIRARRSKLVNLVETMPENAAKDLLHQLQDPSNPLGQLHRLELHRATARQLERKLKGRAEGHNRGVSSRSTRIDDDKSTSGAAKPIQGTANAAASLPDYDYKGIGFKPIQGTANLNRVENKKSGSIWDVRYLNFVLDASKIGLPVAFLMTVKTWYKIRKGKTNETDTVNRILYLKADTFDGVLNTLDSTSSASFYHESMHAYLEIMEINLKEKYFVREGNRYYKNAPLFGTDVRGDDEYRIFTEAAAGYVGAKIGAWVELPKVLQTIKNSKASPERKKALISGLRQSYNNAQKERVYGYQFIGGKQFFTKLPISQELKDYLDQEILEGQFSREFDVEFREILGDMLISTD